MRSQDALDLEDLCFDALDTTTEMTQPESRFYGDDDTYHDEELGLRLLLEHPEALSRALRSQLL